MSATSERDGQQVMQMPQSNELPPQPRCRSYRPGHTPHQIQARLSTEAGGEIWDRVERVDDDGTIVLEGGKVLWNHSPERLRAALRLHGLRVAIAKHGLLKVPHTNSSYLFSVADGPSPCR
ncbi:MAG TPA: hypothetical protein VIC35_09410 [Acidimicrobiia bacterium]